MRWGLVFFLGYPCASGDDGSAAAKAALSAAAGKAALQRGREFFDAGTGE